MFELSFADSADVELKRLEQSPSEEAKTKQIKKALGNLSKNPRHPALQTHKFDGFSNPFDPKEDVFVAYAQQHTPSAARILWCYGPQQKKITILAIVAHP